MRKTVAWRRTSALYAHSSIFTLSDQKRQDFCDCNTYRASAPWPPSPQGDRDTPCDFGDTHPLVRGPLRLHCYPDRICSTAAYHQDTRGIRTGVSRCDLLQPCRSSPASWLVHPGHAPRRAPDRPAYPDYGAWHRLESRISAPAWSPLRLGATRFRHSGLLSARDG